MAAAVIFFIISLIFRQKDKEYHKMCDSTSAELGALLARHLGDSAVSEDAMNAFRARMGEFSKLCDMVTQSEAEIRKFLEDFKQSPDETGRLQRDDRETAADPVGA